MTEEQRRICLRAIDHYGVAHQQEKAKEEMGELLVELSRIQDNRTDMNRLCEELADVIIMAQQLRIIFGAADVDYWITLKLDRLVDRMNGGEDSE